MKLKYILIILLIVAVSTTAMVICDKPSIHSAEYDDLEAIYDIGEVLSLRVVSYLDINPNADIDDLTNIKGIGDYRLKLLKRRYR